MLENEPLPPSISKPFFSKGFLCSICKDLVKDLDILQHQVVNVKKSIISKLRGKKGRNEDVNDSITNIDDFMSEPFEEKMEVEKIIQKRVVKVRKFEYLVKWKNYDRPEYNTWELAEGLEGAEDLIKKFEILYSKHGQNGSNKANGIKNNINVSISKKTESSSKLLTQRQTEKTESLSELIKGKSKESNTMVPKINQTHETESNSTIPNMSILQKENNVTIYGGPKVTIKPRRKKMKKILERRDSKYLVEWENCSKEETSWELRSAIPSNILDSFDKHGVDKSKQDKNRKELEHEENDDQHTVQWNNLPQNESCGSLKSMNIHNEEKKLLTMQKGIRAQEEDVPKQDNLYLIERLLKKKGSKYQVKWKGFPEEQSTWEPKSAIPKEIIETFQMNMISTKASDNAEKNMLPIESNTEDRKKSHTKISSKQKKQTRQNHMNSLNLNLRRANHYAMKRSRRINHIPNKQNLKSKKRSVLVNNKKIKIKGKNPINYGGQIVKSKTEKASQKTEELYLIEKLLKKKGSKYLVKWKNYPEEQNTWEPQSNIPEAIIKYFENERLSERVSDRKQNSKLIDNLCGDPSKIPPETDNLQNKPDGKDDNIDNIAILPSETQNSSKRKKEVEEGDTKSLRNKMKVVRKIQEEDTTPTKNQKKTGGKPQVEGANTAKNEKIISKKAKMKDSVLAKDNRNTRRKVTENYKSFTKDEKKIRGEDQDVYSNLGKNEKKAGNKKKRGQIKPLRNKKKTGGIAKKDKSNLGKNTRKRLRSTVHVEYEKKNIKNSQEEGLGPTKNEKHTREKTKDEHTNHAKYEKKTRKMAQEKGKSPTNFFKNSRGKYQEEDANFLKDDRKARRKVKEENLKILKDEKKIRGNSQEHGVNPGKHNKEKKGIVQKNSGKKAKKDAQEEDTIHLKDNKKSKGNVLGNKAASLKKEQNARGKAQKKETTLTKPEQNTGRKAQGRERNPTKKEQKISENFQGKQKKHSIKKQKNTREKEKRNSSGKDKKEHRGKKVEMVRNDNIFNIESLVKRKGSKYLIKWENFHENQNTWESRSSIPCMVLQVS